MSIFKPQTRTDRALAAHQSHITGFGTGLCGRVAVSAALDLFDRGYKAQVETAVIAPKGKPMAHAWVVINGERVLDFTTGFSGCAEEYRVKSVIDNNTLVVLNRKDIRRLAKRAKCEDNFHKELFKLANTATIARAQGSSASARVRQVEAI
jgi:hypothetical protein